MARDSISTCGLPDADGHGGLQVRVELPKRDLASRPSQYPAREPFAARCSLCVQIAGSRRPYQTVNDEHAGGLVSVACCGHV
jgi:hypothetical protein